MKSNAHGNIGKDKLATSKEKDITNNEIIAEYNANKEDFHQRITLSMQRIDFQINFSYWTSILVYFVSLLSGITFLLWGLVSFTKGVSNIDTYISLGSSAVGLILLFVLAIKSPLNMLHAKLINSHRLNIIYATFFRQINQVDLYLMSNLATQKNSSPEKQERIISQIISHMMEIADETFAQLSEMTSKNIF
jgi:hypothetical protein